MRILHSTPAADGFRMPAEYEPHNGTLLIWPERPDTWPYQANTASKCFVEIASAIAYFEPVTMLVSSHQYDHARRLLPASIRVVEMSSDDSWARDTAPVFVRGADDEVRGIDFGFNAWGGIYGDYEADNALARKCCDLLGYDCYERRDLIMEGGSICVDGDGTAMVTEECLLAANRNPALNKNVLDATLMAYLGVTKVLWLPYGLCDDETGGHIDNVAAFAAPGEIVLAWTDDESDINYERCKANYTYLSSYRDAKGRRPHIHKLPLPTPITATEHDCAGLSLYEGMPTRTPYEQLTASYVNFYICNGAVIVPGFGQPGDSAAVDILRPLFPDREVFQLMTASLLIGGGNIHCITKQY